jgi:hypothetical protein
LFVRGVEFGDDDRKETRSNGRVQREEKLEKVAT